MAKKDPSKDELLRAKTEQALAETRKLNAEAMISEMAAEVSRVKRDEVLRAEEEALADDRYHHIYRFDNAVSSGSVKHCMGQLATWIRMAGNEKLNIEISFNSPGGSVIDGLALFDFIQEVKRDGHHVTTAALGMAASMAGILLQAGNKRVMAKESYVLIHEISTGAIGKIGEIEDVVEFVKKIQKRVLDIFAERSEKSAAYFAKHWRRKDWWLDSDECLEIGFVDEVR